MRLHHLARRAADCERAAALHGGLLGLQELRRQSAGGVVSSVWLTPDDGTLMLERDLRGVGAEQGSGHVLALAVDTLDAWVAELQAAGVRIVDRMPHTVYFADPDGHRVGLSRYPLP